VTIVAPVVEASHSRKVPSEGYGYEGIRSTRPGPRVGETLPIQVEHIRNRVGHRLAELSGPRRGGDREGLQVVPLVHGNFAAQDARNFLNQHAELGHGVFYVLDWARRYVILHQS